MIVKVLDFLLIPSLLFLFCFFLTWSIKDLLKKLDVLAKPTARGMHKTATVSGGGISVVITTLFCLIYFYYEMGLERDLYLSSLMGLSVIGLLGLLDDVKGISYRARLFVHFSLAIIIISLFFQGILIKTLYPLPISGIFLFIFFVLFLVWFTNLYNFMDGINGLAVVQAISFFLSISLILYLYYPEDYFYFFSLAAIFFGFLYWNFPIAKIFLGDTGSGTIGIFISINLLYLFVLDVQLFWSGIILLSIFIVDSTYTLFIRVFKGLPFYKAHNSHAYQRAAIEFESHSKVTISVFIINIFILLPLALLIFETNFNPLYIIFGVFSALSLVCFYFKAGIQENLL